MATQNPVKYAEDTLSVHIVWTEANTRLAAHEASKVAYLSALSGIRYTEQQIAAREGEFTLDRDDLASNLTYRRRQLPLREGECRGPSGGDEGNKPR